MRLREESDILMRKVAAAAGDSFETSNGDVKSLEPDKLFEIGYMHGFNCGHNIYDAAEEKIDALKRQDEVPVKDFPSGSENGVRSAHESFRQFESRIRSMDNRSIYINAYQKGFQEAWKDVPEEAMTEKMFDIINYYI